MIRKKTFPVCVMIALIAVAAMITSWLVHRPQDVHTWKGEIWADRAGYYIYLPATFMYHFDATQLPEKIEEKTGYGFGVENGKIATKYTSGVALLLSPFFVATHYIAKIFHIEEERGFGAVYHRMADLAAIFYLIFGLIILSHFLRYYFKPLIRWLILLLLFAGTNLFYYSVIDPLMSHVYSFFLFSGSLLFCKKFLEERKIAWFAIWSLFSALIILIRPTNILILSVFFFWDISSFREVFQRIRLILHPVRLIIFLGIVILVFLPQLAYWKYLHGSFLFYSYGNEGFTNWNHPKFMEVWFSTLNGWFLYSPMVIFLLAGIIFMIVNKKPNGILVLIIFLGVSYAISSWYNWYYGCSFGQRSYVEYYALLAFPFGFLMEDLVRRKRIWLRIFPLLLILSLVFFNIRMTFAFDHCFTGSSWDWSNYSTLLEKADLIPEQDRTLQFTNDFENIAIVWPERTTLTEKHSGMQSVIIDQFTEFSCRYDRQFWDFTKYYPSTATVHIWILNREAQNTGAILVCSIERDGKLLYWQGRNIDEFVHVNKWSDVKGVFPVPWGYDGSVKALFYLWNKEHKKFFADDLSVVFDK